MGAQAIRHIGQESAQGTEIPSVVGLGIRSLRGSLFRRSDFAENGLGGKQRTQSTNLFLPDGKPVSMHVFGTDRWLHN